MRHPKTLVALAVGAALALPAAAAATGPAHQAPANAASGPAHQAPANAASGPAHQALAGAAARAGAAAQSLPEITLAPIADQSFDIYPGLLPLPTRELALQVSPADAQITAQATSADKVAVTPGAASVNLAPFGPGAAYVRVVASKPGYAPAARTFQVQITATADTPYDWHGDAKIGGSGYVTGSVYSDIEPDVLYAMTDIGGAYRYDYPTHYWIGLNDDATNTSAYSDTAPDGPGRGATFVTSIAPDPVQPGRVYMVAGGSAANSALYRSDDHGDNWARFKLPTGISVNGNDQTNRSTGPRLAIDPKDNSVVYYGGRTSGIWRSTDYGETFARWTNGAIPPDYDPLFVLVDPRSPVDAEGHSSHIVAATVGTASSAWTGTAPDRHREFGSLWETHDSGATWTEVPGQPAPGARDCAGFVAEHADWDQDGNLVAAYAEFGLGVNSYDLENPADHSRYVRGGTTAVSAVGSNSNFAHDGRVYRFDYGIDRTTASANNITPPNVFTREYPPLAELQADYPGQHLQRGGFGGVSVDQSPARKGAIVVSTFHRHDRMAEELVQYTPDSGATWRVAHSEVAGSKDFRGYGYIDKDNGLGAAVHWAFDIQLN
ncbi:MAG: hypothetical protein LBT54_07390, partial [Bifidobacteriaceae bacterium]|nr:hypothetical protein [Bifidobacteriaceae bacterium]